MSPATCWQCSHQGPPYLSVKPHGPLSASSYLVSGSAGQGQWPPLFKALSLLVFGDITLSSVLVLSVSSEGSFPLKSCYFSGSDLKLFLTLLIAPFSMVPITSNMLKTVHTPGFLPVHPRSARPQCQLTLPCVTASSPCPAPTPVPHPVLPVAMNSTTLWLVPGNLPSVLYSPCDVSLTSPQ